MNTIPPMTDPMGRHWTQPPTSAIELDDTHALMSRETLAKLPEYSGSIPTGVYPGKMWRCQRADGSWILRWFGEVPGRPTLCSNNQREVLLVEDVALSAP